MKSLRCILYMLFITAAFRIKTKGCHQSLLPWRKVARNPPWTKAALKPLVDISCNNWHYLEKVVKLWGTQLLIAPLSLLTVQCLCIWNWELIPNVGLDEILPTPPLNLALYPSRLLLQCLMVTFQYKIHKLFQQRMALQVSKLSTLRNCLKQQLTLPI